MSRGERRAVLLSCLKKARPVIFAVCGICALNLLIFSLYRLPMEPFCYAAVLAAAGFLVLFFLVYRREIERAEERSRILASDPAGWWNLPAPEDPADEDYQEMIRTLLARVEAMRTEYESGRQETVDYYTTWAHQIKTPIAVIHMMLDENGREEDRGIAAELFRIEQYVDMVLQYIRLGSETNDLVLQEYDLDDLLRRTIRKYASQFIHRKLGLEFEPTGLRIVTDELWFCLIVEQFLSNAIKYTPAGTIRIFAEGSTLHIADAGIGIAPEDIPRIFEKGFTGGNGRLGGKSSGLGLYLAKSAADKLNIPVKVESTVGEGSTFSLFLTQNVLLRD